MATPTADMPHLAPPTAPTEKEAHDATEAKVADKPAVDLTNPKLSREYTFVFRYRDVEHGTFTSRVVNIAQRRAMGIMRASLAGGVPYEALDPLTDEMNLMVAHFTYGLIGDRPDWAQSFDDEIDVRRMQALYAEVLSHEATFLGRD